MHLLSGVWLLKCDLAENNVNIKYKNDVIMIGLLTWKLIEDIVFIDNTK